MRRRFTPTVDGLEARLPLDGEGAEACDWLEPEAGFGARDSEPPESLSIDESGYEAALRGSSLTGGDWTGYVVAGSLEPVKAINPYD